MRFETGRAGAGAANAAYITRATATEGRTDAIATHNYPSYITHHDNYKHLKGEIVEYNRQREVAEIRKHNNRCSRPKANRTTEDAPKVRTHFRAIASFEGRVGTERARDLAKEWIERNFPDARALIAVHQDTENTHCHINIQARQIDGRKIDLSPQRYRNLDNDWARIYGREFGPYKYHDHLAKKEETRQWKQARALGEYTPRPQRSPKHRSPATHRAHDRRNHGAHKVPARGNQSGSTAPHRSARETEPTTARSQRAIDRAHRSTDEATRDFGRAVAATDELRQEIEIVRDIHDRDDRDR
jgi:hypothetical protein